MNRHEKFRLDFFESDGVTHEFVQRHFELPDFDPEELKIYHSYCIRNFRVPISYALQPGIFKSLTLRLLPCLPMSGSSKEQSVLRDEMCSEN